MCEHRLIDDKVVKNIFGVYKINNIDVYRNSNSSSVTELYLPLFDVIVEYDKSSESYCDSYHKFLNSLFSIEGETYV